MHHQIELAYFVSYAAPSSTTPENHCSFVHVENNFRFYYKHFSPTETDSATVQQFFFFFNVNRIGKIKSVQL